MNYKILMNARECYPTIAPCVLQAYWKQVASHFIRYTNGHAGMACMEIYELCD